ncbi:NAD-dependent deacylase [Vannielia litorea]|uniref:NAD-dependent deacylase n=1 Tax=Vannielia litorea TaxID=1217970 RepID=UPI001BCE5670|nr:NAD-dependent deacylase [Vannielia litorea]MBS8228484.1 NAD-dependent deacylase [Vannielia litorea]
MRPITILTGAGISAESGIATFRDPGGIWAQYDIEDVATPEAFARNPGLVLDFYNMRREKVRAAKPNAAHNALGKLQKSYPGAVHIITQNVDNLHEKGGAEVIHMHGAHHTALCAACGHRWPAPPTMDLHDPCPDCRQPATRPDVVWFGEVPYHMERIGEILSQTALFVSIGTSGAVYPAAGFVRHARQSGAETLELNLEPSEITPLFDEARHGPATELVPAWVEELLR